MVVGSTLGLIWEKNFYKNKDYCYSGAKNSTKDPRFFFFFLFHRVVAIDLRNAVVIRPGYMQYGSVIKSEL